MMVKAMLLVKETGGEGWEDKGSREFAVLPRVGEHVELQENDLSHLYRVVAVRHSQITHVTVCGLYAVYVGKTEEALEKIFKDTPTPNNAEEGGVAGFLPRLGDKRSGGR